MKKALLTLCLGCLSLTAFGQNDEISFASSKTFRNDFENVEGTYTATSDVNEKSLLFLRAMNTSAVTNLKIGLSSVHFCSGITRADWLLYQNGEVIEKLQQVPMERLNSEVIIISNFTAANANTWSITNPGRYWIDNGYHQKLESGLASADEVSVRVSNQYCDTEIFNFELSRDKSGLEEVLAYHNRHPVNPDLTDIEKVQTPGKGIGQFVLLLGGCIGGLILLSE